MILYIYVFSDHNNKDFNFSTPNRGLGLKSTLKTKTNVLVSNNFSDASPREGGIQITPYHKNVPFLCSAIFQPQRGGHPINTLP
jgi:hypothetical protein